MICNLNAQAPAALVWFAIIAGILCLLFLGFVVWWSIVSYDGRPRD